MYKPSFTLPLLDASIMCQSTIGGFGPHVLQRQPWGTVPLARPLILRGDLSYHFMVTSEVNSSFRHCPMKAHPAHALWFQQ